MKRGWVEVGGKRKWDKSGRWCLPDGPVRTAGRCWPVLAAERKWGLWPSHFRSQGSQGGISGGRPQTWVRKSEVSNGLGTGCSHHGGEKGTPLRARAGLASAQRATACHRALFMPLLPKRGRGMFAHRGPKSARVEKKHMESITASTCGLEKSALSPHHPLLPAISEFLFFRSKNME